MFRFTFIFVVFVNAACATEPVCVPIERCPSFDGGPVGDVCEWIGLKDGPKAYTEHPDGVKILSDNVTNADLEFLKSVVTLECSEYVLRVFISEDRLTIIIGGLSGKPGRGFYFKRDEDGRWESSGLFSIS